MLSFWHRIKSMSVASVSSDGHVRIANCCAGYAVMSVEDQWLARCCKDEVDQSVDVLVFDAVSATRHSDVPDILADTRDEPGRYWRLEEVTW